MSYDPRSYERQCDHYATYGTLMQPPSWTYAREYNDPTPFELPAPKVHKHTLESKKDWESMFEKDFRKGLGTNRRRPDDAEIDREVGEYVRKAVDSRKSQIHKSKWFKDTVLDAQVDAVNPLNTIVRGVGWMSGTPTNSPREEALQKATRDLPKKYGIEEDHVPGLLQKIRNPPPRWVNPDTPEFVRRLRGESPRVLDKADKVSTGIGWIDHVAEKLTPTSHLPAHAVEAKIGTALTIKTGVKPVVDWVWTGRRTRESLKDSNRVVRDAAVPIQINRFKKITRRMMGKNDSGD